jgi:hypothetical protein
LPDLTFIGAGTTNGRGTTYEEFLFNVTTRGVSNFDLFFREIKNK